ncbi:hypothetical protein AB0M50_06310 [Nonomuraea fuscirosea]|uniref:hypothetical protein n=1 Tax=Nonomuraea fuscirosea TaxID=1291556 RepID=UPI00343AA684
MNDGLAYTMTFSPGPQPVDDFAPKLGGISRFPSPPVSPWSSGVSLSERGRVG